METNENPNPTPAAAQARKKKPRASRNQSEEGRMATGLSSCVRWQILRELAKGQALPIAELDHRIKGGNTIYHMPMLIAAGWVEKKFRILYGLTENVRVDAAAGLLDLGPLLLKLTPTVK